jgi:hypothetical protein
MSPDQAVWLVKVRCVEERHNDALGDEIRMRMEAIICEWIMDQD